MIKAKLSDRETQVRFARFLAVGASAYVVQLLALKTALHWLATNPAFVVSFLCSTSTHYALNRCWALPSGREDTLRQFREYLFTMVVSFVINFSIFHFCLSVLDMGKVWAAAIAVPPSTVVVFFLLNYRVFRASPHGS